jgi:Holliday junction resolvase-like predicted endonuclease
MKKIPLLTLVMLVALYVQAQKINKIINAKKVAKIEKKLSADDMQGRGLYSVGLDKAADFIAASFKKNGLQPPGSNSSFFQEFTMVEAKQTSASGTIDGVAQENKNILAFTSKENLVVNDQSGYEQVKIGAGDKLLNTAYRYVISGKNYIVWVDTAHAKNFASLLRLKGQQFKSDNSIVFVIAEHAPQNFSFAIQHAITEKHLKNVAGIIPGKSKKDEYVIFSGHYDHLGIDKPNADGDSIYNGANDDAAGTTAVIMLSKYFKKMNNNERTIVFAAFTAEESGGFGSQYFSRQFDAAKVMAMFNIEMIGTESKWGINSAYITGYEKTDMGKILERNLEGTSFKFYPDPYPDQQLFYRSDNATLARLGVPAHTISTSKMDNEPFYHTLDDEIETLDMKNMAEIIKAIALSSRTIVSGADAPSRVDTKQLR